MGLANLVCSISIKRKLSYKSVNVIFLFLLVNLRVNVVSSAHWDHAVDLDEDFRLLWSIANQDITFEVQARTLGYVGLGFSKDGTIYGADIVIGWLDQGSVHFQDRHIKKHGDGEPLIDPSQDYELLLGYENSTHTVIRFKRKLDTCDVSYDVPITNDTMRIIYMYHDEDPRGGAYGPGSLPDYGGAFKQSRSLFLTQRVNQIPIRLDSRTKIMELRNQDAKLPLGDDTMHWCKMFKLNDLNRKHHIIRYEPVFESTASVPFLNHIILYECPGSSPALEVMSRENGRPCYSSDSPVLTCTSIVAAWTRGSEGFTFPEQTGYPLQDGIKYYLMETHYSNYLIDKADLDIRASPIVDNSGLKLYYTSALRAYDAGVLSIGMEPNWRHIIPPGQERVVSEGHCVEECTQKAFPSSGINIFAVMMRTHQIGKQIKLRQIRHREELLPIAHDRYADPNYQEYRRLPSPIRALPGDRLIAECIYDSSTRKAITLGGMTAREETCLVLTLYYPRQKELTKCHSIPSLPTVLHSLGINELAPGSNPVRIASPPELAGMPLETRLITYDWEHHFDSFQRATRRGSFKSICWNAKSTPIPGTDNMDAYAPNVTRKIKPSTSCSFNAINNPNSFYNNRNRYVTESETNVDIPLMDEDDNINIIEGAARSKVSRSSSTESMGFSGSTKSGLYSAKLFAFLLFMIFLNSFRIS